MAISPHRQEYVAECYDEDKIVPLDLYCAVTPVFQSENWTLQLPVSIVTHTYATKQSDRGHGGKRKGFTAWV